MTTRRKLLPTSAPKYVPPEFLEEFARHGWQHVERMFGKPSVRVYRAVLGAKRMAEARKRYLAEEASGKRSTAMAAFGSSKASLRTVRG